jgi:hypothetical protein
LRPTIDAPFAEPGRTSGTDHPDLDGFWERSYPAVKKELMGRYRRHYWPDDPRAAKPTAQAKKKGCKKILNTAVLGENRGSSNIYTLMQPLPEEGSSFVHWIGANLDDILPFSNGPSLKNRKTDNSCATKPDKSIC